MGTRKSEDRKNVVESIKNAAQLYKQYLVGRRFLYVFDSRYIEVMYKVANFRHLTGVATKLTANEFYRAATRKQLQVNQIYFTSDHPYNLCIKKIKHIEEIAVLATSENFILEEIETSTKSYKFGATDLKLTLCLNKELDDDGNEKGDCYIVESLRDEDCFSKSKNVYAVTHIFSKANDEKKYTDLHYADANYPIGKLDVQIQNMLSDITQGSF